MKNQNTTNQKIIQYMQLARSNLSLSAIYSLMNTYGNINTALQNIPEKAKRTNKKIIIPSQETVENEYAQIIRMGGNVISLYDKIYPEILKNTPFPPFVLTALGDISLINQEIIAVVGSRRAGFEGKKIAQLLSHCLGSEGYVICSGMATGIDTAAHAAVLNNKMPTIGILGCGVDVIYPKENQGIYYKIIEQGLLLSEFPLGTKPLPVNFPNRNRIIAGLAIATVVVEATKNSGSLITARHALEAGREIFAVPGSPFDGRHDGTNQLIKEGAILADSCDTIIDALQFSLNKGNLNLFEPECKNYLEVKNLNFNTSDSKIQKIKNEIISQLNYSPISIENIAEDLKEEIQLILIALVELSIEERIQYNFLNEVYLTQIDIDQDLI